eukprot:gnl/TRDRNA2_/TRDRNA2_137371_c0_seq1.p1 gnl/TRDRNA2_/TRDRNA2_137371_c0~~gnl/TRDRNA2_/TRDRNA2_137371_c0_seq1.p1  ORF type:complete len:208 (-),score=38.08 gnl/TRDRNA2_/TRDRNA2_137371_c0_seq1:104-727(-)
MRAGEERVRELQAADGGKPSEATRAALEQLRTELVWQANAMLYPGVTADEVRRRRETYGAAKWTEAVMERLVKHGPFLGAGAGLGPWQAELQRRGVDVVAMPAGTSTGASGGAGSVQSLGKASTVAQSLGKASLLLVFPPAGPTATNCLTEFRGQRLFYVGEGRGGISADDSFFDALIEGWNLEEAFDLDPLPGCFEKLYALHRIPS